MTNTKTLIAVCMPDTTRRLYRVDTVPGMTIDEMFAATKTEIPTAAVVLIGLPRPVQFLGPEVA